MKDDLPLALILVFVPFSLVSLGGGTGILAGPSSSGRRASLGHGA